MFNEQIGKYQKVMAHVVASPAVWLVIAISTLDNIWTYWIGQGQAEWISWIAIIIIFYIGTGIYYCFTHGEFRVTVSQAYKSAGPVILPILLFSIKLTLLWMIPLFFVILVATAGGESTIVAAIMITVSLMIVSIIFGNAFVFMRNDYRMWHTVKLIFSSLGGLLSKTLLPMLLFIAMLALSIPLSFNEGMQPWLTVMTPLINLTEYAFFLYVVGVLTSEPDYLQMPDPENS